MWSMQSLGGNLPGACMSRFSASWAKASETTPDRWMSIQFSHAVQEIAATLRWKFSVYQINRNGV